MLLVVTKFESLEVVYLISNYSKSIVTEMCVNQIKCILL